MCELDANYSIRRTELYSAWQRWCEHNGREHAGNEATFGRDLAAARPEIETEQRRTGNGDERVRFYVGIRLQGSGRDSGSQRGFSEPPGWAAAHPPYEGR